MTQRQFLAGATGIAALTGAACAAAPRTGGQFSVPVSSGVATALSGASGSGAPRGLETFDLHCDTIDCVGLCHHKPYADFVDKHAGTLSSNNAQVSADRMGDARWVQCYAIWIPPTSGADATEISAIEWYREAVAWFGRQMEECGDRVAQVRDFGEVASILDAGKVAAILTVENAACLEEGVHVVDEFARDGVLVASLTWNHENALASGVYGGSGGLSDLGRECVVALEDRGITLDVSHLNDQSFWELDALATRPYLATHSNARAVCAHPRNLTDEQFGAILARGGLVGLNFYDAFVCDDGHEYGFDELARHVEHWLELGGEDAIALGSDRDGCESPEWLADCSMQESLHARFAERFGEVLAHKLFFANAMRFFGAA